MTSRLIREELFKKSSEARANITKRFFKTEKGGYAYGDIFIGVRVPDVRKIALKFKETPLNEVIPFFKSDVHEERLLALIFLVEQYKKSKPLARKKIVRLYLKHRLAVNNWDLVDLSSPYILGAHAFETGSVQLLEKLLRSKRQWDRRISIVSTWFLIRQGQTEMTFLFASRLLSDKEDLMHKATGWMLREAGKKDIIGLKKFLLQYGKKMPRTMLRYAIEKFNPNERKKILLLTKN